jgi:hypothetical protein
MSQLYRIVVRTKYVGSYQYEHKYLTLEQAMLHIGLHAHNSNVEGGELCRQGERTPLLSWSTYARNGF